LASHFLWPAFVIAGYSMLLIAIGFGPAVRLMSRDRPPMAVLIAHVVGISLLATPAYIDRFYLGVPDHPVPANLGLLALSLGACLTIGRGGINWHDSVRRLGSILPRAWPYAVVPALAILWFSTLFLASGAEMLSAGQDELAYAGITDHIMNHMH